MPTATTWTEANSKFTANLSGGVSVAAGFMGADMASSIDLGGTRVLWLLGDTFWATAAGQNRSQCLFLRNTIALQTGSYDLSASTLTFYAGIETNGTGNTPGSFFPQMPPCNWSWANSGVVIDGKLLILIQDIQPAFGGLGFRVEGWRAVMVDNPGAAPTAWTQIPIEVPSVSSEPLIGLHMVDAGDGYIYSFGRGADEDTAMYALRWPREDAKAGRLMDPQWWRGSVHGWSNLPRYSERTGKIPVAVMPAPSATEGSVTQKSNGDWVTIHTPGWGGTSLSYAVSSSLSGPFPALTAFYTPPESTMLNGQGQQLYDVYAGKGHKEQTWSGKAADDLLCSYAANTDPLGGASIYTDTSVYFPKFVKVTGL